MSVMLCDDEEMFVQALAAALRHRGHRVAAATTDPDEIVALAQRGRPRACVLDLNYSGQPRADLPAAITEASPDTAILTLSGVVTPLAWQLYDAGLVDGLASKACTLDVIDRALSEVLVGRRTTAGASRAAGRSNPAEQLTERELDVLALLVQGASTREIGDTLAIGQSTARSHVQHLFQKLGVHSRVQAVRQALADGLVGVAS